MGLINLLKKPKKENIKEPFSIHIIRNLGDEFILKYQNENKKTTYFIADKNLQFYTILEDGSLKSKGELFEKSRRNGQDMFGSPIFDSWVLDNVKDRFFPKETKEYDEEMDKFFYLSSKEEAVKFFKSEKSLKNKLIEYPLEASIQDRIDYDFNNTINLFLEKDIKQFFEERKNLKKQPRTKYFVAKTSECENKKGWHDLLLGIVANSEELSERFIKECLIQNKIPVFSKVYSGFSDKDEYPHPMCEVYAIPPSCNLAIINIERSNPLYIENLSYFKEENKHL